MHEHAEIGDALSAEGVEHRVQRAGSLFSTFFGPLAAAEGVRDYAQVKADGAVSKPVADAALKMMDVDALGLDTMDRKLLLAVIELGHLLHFLVLERGLHQASGQRRTHPWPASPSVVSDVARRQGHFPVAPLRPMRLGSRSDAGP